MRFITRKEWKAKDHTFTFAFHSPNRITIHHLCEPYYDEKIRNSFKGSETLRMIQKYHMEKLKYIDIGYHRIIGLNGDIYEGRDFNIIGSHVRKFNTGNIGILLYGNFQYEFPSNEQIESLKHIILEIKTTYPHMDIPKCVFGHKDFVYHSCCGEHLYPIIHNIKYGFIPLK
jgi:hypothetical protein